MSPKYSLKVGKITDHNSLKRIHRQRPGTCMKVTLTPVTSAHPNTTPRLGYIYENSGRGGGVRRTYIKKKKNEVGVAHL